MTDEEKTPPSRAPKGTLAPTPALASSATKTVEAWAAEKGLAQFNDDGTLDFEHRCPWEFQCAKFHFAWGSGRELTEAEFDAAITTVTSLTQG